MRLLLLVLLLNVLSVCLAQRYAFDVYSTEEGLPQAGVYDILEDQFGYLWIAIEDGGVCRFDGSEFKVFDADNGLADTKIRCLYTDRSGQLWMGSENAGAMRLSEEKCTNYGINSGLSTGHVRCFAEDSLGTLWTGTLGGGIYYLSGEHFTAWHLNAELPDLSIRTALTDSKGRVWFGSDKGVIRLEKEGFSFFGEEEGLCPGEVLTLFEDDFGVIWAGSSLGAAFYDDQGWHTLNDPKIAGNRIRSIASDALGNMWFGSRKGAVVLDGKTGDTQLIGELNGLSNSRIRKIFKDSSNSLWFGTYFGGICRLNQMATQYFDARSGFIDNNVTAMCHEPSGLYWFGTYEGQVYSFDGDTVIRKYRSTDLTDNKINALICLQNRVFAGMNEDGLWVWNEKGGKRIPGFKNIRAVLPLNAEKVLAAGTFGLALVDLKAPENQQWKVFTSEVVEGGFSSLAYRADTILAGHAGGLLLIPFDPQSLNFGEAFSPDELEGIAVTSMASDQHNNTWIATDGEGLFRYNGKGFKAYKSKRYLESQFIRFVLMDNDQNLWVGTPKGVQKLELDPSQELVLNSKVLGDEEGFSKLETNRGAVLADDDGSLWFGTIRGLVRFREGMNFSDNSAPPLWISRIDLNNQLVEWDTLGLKTDPFGLPLQPELSYKQNHLTFCFRAIEPGAPDKVVFQYQLQGYEDEWSDLIQTDKVTYPNLPPGAYTFLVRARNRDGIWNEQPLSYSFSIIPPVYQRTWFVILMIVLGAMLVVSAIRVRIRILKRQNLILENRVSERTWELQEEQRKSERLLLNILPEHTARELKESGKARAKKYPSASVLFSDFKGFTTLTENLESDELVSMLDECFRAFDKHTTAFKVEKIKTIGDAYMCATGIGAEDPDHAVHLVEFALKMAEEMERINAQRRLNGKAEWPVRIGINSGPVIAGVVGEKKFAYDIWGDTVNTAARMESASKPGRVNVSESTMNQINHRFRCEARGKQVAKNKGELEMYFVVPPGDHTN